MNVMANVHSFIWCLHIIKRYICLIYIHDIINVYLLCTLYVFEGVHTCHNFALFSIIVSLVVAMLEQNCMHVVFLPYLVINVTPYPNSNSRDIIIITDILPTYTCTSKLIQK